MTNKDIQIIDDIKIDQTSLVQQAIRSGKGVIIINDNRHNIVGADIAKLPWQELLEMVIEKTPKPKLRNIEAEVIRIANYKHNLQREGAEYLGIKRSTYGARLSNVKNQKSITLLRN